ncbi:MAG: hypothetical protein HIU84_09115 [Acidobacteria bacterium]|nr:hypothetical protein [Acidobacteriota bacterium]
MNQFMVVATFGPATLMDELTTMVPGEMTQVKVLKGERVPSTVRVSVARDKVFLEVSAADAAGAEVTLQRLPMAKFWDLEVFQVHAPVSDPV